MSGVSVQRLPEIAEHIETYMTFCQIWQKNIMDREQFFGIFFSCQGCGNVGARANAQADQRLGALGHLQAQSRARADGPATQSIRTRMTFRNVELIATRRGKKRFRVRFIVSSFHIVSCIDSQEERTAFDFLVCGPTCQSVT